MSDSEPQSSKKKIVDREDSESIDEKDGQDLEAAKALTKTNAKPSAGVVSSKVANVQLDRGGQENESNYIFRRHWWQLWYYSFLDFSPSTKGLNLSSCISDCQVTQGPSASATRLVGRCSGRFSLQYDSGYGIIDCCLDYSGHRCLITV
jgi:hypothetical protein